MDVTLKSRIWVMQKTCWLQLSNVLKNLKGQVYIYSVKWWTEYKNNKLWQ